MAFSNFGRKFGKSSSSGTIDSKYVTAAASLPEEATEFVPLFDLCEKSRNAMKGAFCKDIIIVKNDTTYSSPTIHVSLSYQDLSTIIQEANVKKLIKHYEEVSELINFPFSDFSSDDKDRIVIKMKSAYELDKLFINDGDTVSVVIVPGAYKAGGAIKKPGVSFRIVAFVI